MRTRSKVPGAQRSTAVGAVLSNSKQPPWARDDSRCSDRSMGAPNSLIDACIANETTATNGNLDLQAFGFPKRSFSMHASIDATESIPAEVSAAPSADQGRSLPPPGPPASLFFCSVAFHTDHQKIRRIHHQPSLDTRRAFIEVTPIRQSTVDATAAGILRPARFAWLLLILLGQRGFLVEDYRQLSSHGGIEFDILLPLSWNVFVEVNRFHRTSRHTGFAVDTLVRMNEEPLLAFVEAPRRHRAYVHTVGVLAPVTGLTNYMRHGVGILRRRPTPRESLGIARQITCRFVGPSLLSPGATRPGFTSPTGNPYGG